MLSVKVPLKEAEKVKRFLMKKGLLNKQYSVAKQPPFILFPVLKWFKSKHAFVQASLKKRSVKPQDLKASLNDQLSKKELVKVKSSLDVIGDIAILEVPKELARRARLIAQHLLQSRPTIKTVLQKGRHEGELRVQRLKFLAGEDKRETVHKESGVRIKVNVETVYFSPRLSEERKRIASQIKVGEKVLVLFSGCGVYPLVFAKNTKTKEIVGVELNPEGHRYALENVRLNKVRNVRFYLGDVREVVPELREKFDRVVMPAPASAIDFLPLALSVARKGAVIHGYTFEKEGELEKAKNQVRAAFKKAGLKGRVLRLVKCGQVGQRRYRVCIDARLQ